MHILYGYLYYCPAGTQYLVLSKQINSVYPLINKNTYICMCSTNKMSKTLNGLAKNGIKMQPIPSPASPSSPSSPSTKVLKFQVSKLPLIRNISSTSETDFNGFTVLTIHEVFILLCSTLLMIAVLQIPTILYFTDSTPPTISSSFTSEIDFKTCSVSNPQLKLHNS